MKRYLSLIKSKKFIAVFISTLVLILALGFSFNGLSSKAFSGHNTFNNCDATYVAYDSRIFDSNCYAFYDKDLKFNIDNKDESIRIPCYTYQFLDGVTYDQKSLLNQRNTTKGVYKILEAGEIAIPVFLENKFSKHVGDFLYLDGFDKYEIKFIFNDLYSIKNVDMNDNEMSVFIGKNSIINQEKKSFAVFDNVSEVYNEVYSFETAKKSFKNTLVLSILSVFIFSLGLLLVVSLIYRKDKNSYFRILLLSGNKKRYFTDSFCFELLIILVPVVPSLILFLCLKNFILSFSIFVPAILISIVNIFINMLKVR